MFTNKQETDIKEVLESVHEGYRAIQSESLYSQAKRVNVKVGDDTHEIIRRVDDRQKIVWWKEHVELGYWERREQARLNAQMDNQSMVGYDTHESY